MQWDEIVCYECATRDIHNYWHLSGQVMLDLSKIAILALEQSWIFDNNIETALVGVTAMGCTTEWYELKMEDAQDLLQKWKELKGPEDEIQD